MSLPDSSSALDRARSKAFFHLLPLLFFCYVIAYVDRLNVSLAKLNMQEDLAHLGFSESVFGFGMGIFFIGYLLLEIPGTLLVEKWRHAEVDQSDHDLMGDHCGDDRVCALPGSRGKCGGRVDCPGRGRHA